ncbi:hypothetical protein NHP190012_09690 [Helicobacter sp. NHP19-012]|uniref:Outer membrane protein n=1 Tax=Helicobacter gastrofelis TaxID=2849642 RepID=A0ABM7SEW8_9HELI|nr:hypothetical protein [Helicobacter sp. NHP19-012]BCZ19327.1 hypothetical protein NHP190012_09690 [Helicobacter sp. NHP19-012]
MQNFLQVLGWFRELAKYAEYEQTILSSSGPEEQKILDKYINSLEAAYRFNLGTILDSSNNFSTILGSPQKYFPITQQLTPVSAPHIQAPNFKKMPSSVNITSTSFINSVSRAVNSTIFENKAYNLGGGAGYQRFFSKYFGFDVFALGGYSFLVPAPGFAALKKLDVGYLQLTADILADFYVNNDASNANFAGFYVGFTEKFNFMGTQAPIAPTHGVLYDSLIDFGTRYQHNAWVYKLGVRIPLYKGTPFRMGYQDFTYFINNTPSNIEVYFMLERLFGKWSGRQTRHRRIR